MFDKTEIVVRAGNGGNGAVSFRREKFVPFGGPDGGDGGNGGNVVLIANTDVRSLRQFRRNRFYRADNGKNGLRKKLHGKTGEDRVLLVPVGTIVEEITETGENTFMADLTHSGQRVVVADGGRGGQGNSHFATSTNQAPRIAQRGEIREDKSLTLELRLIADVGVIGYPNVGKSTLLSSATAARPRIAGYPFTTREPVLGVVEVGFQSFVLAEIPGLLDGAHLGRGLGHEFLRHVGRTRILIHLIDGSSKSPLEDMKRVNNELVLFNAALAQKPQMVVINKIDLPEVQEHLGEVKETLKQAGITASYISAETGEGVAEVMAEVAGKLAQVTPETVIKTPLQVFRPRPKYSKCNVTKDGDTFVIIVPELERFVIGADVTGSGTHRQFKAQIGRFGAVKALEKAGIKPGDKVRFGNTEWEWE